MKIIKAGLLVVSLTALAACSDIIPDSGIGAVNLNSAGNFPQNSPEFFTASVGDRVLFGVDQTTLNAEALSILSAQAAWLIQNPEFTVLVEGHADEQGTREYNLALGARRASAVQAFLVDQGVADGRIRTVTYGKERPLEICSTERCWSKNRRAVTVVSAGGIS